MASVSEFMKMLSTSPPKMRVKLHLIVAVVVALMMSLYALEFRSYVAPDLSRLMFVDGRIASYPNSWEHNRSLVYVSVSYKLQGVRKGERVYIYREQFEQSGLRINSKVLLAVERLEDSSVVREMKTEDGRVLYDDRFIQQVIIWNNDSIKGSLILGGLTALGFFVAALVVALRNRSELFSAGSSHRLQ